MEVKYNSNARRNVSFLMNGMIDHSALMLSLSYTLRSIQIPSPIIYHRSLLETGSPRVFSFCRPCGERSKLVGK